MSNKVTASNFPDPVPGPSVTSHEFTDPHLGSLAIFARALLEKQYPLANPKS